MKQVFQVGDVVNAHHRGDERYKILQRVTKGVSSPHVQLQSLSNPKEIFWLYEVHCHVTFQQRFENARNRRVVRDEAINKILNKPKRK